MKNDRIQVFAVVRVSFYGSDMELTEKVTVQAVLPTVDEAKKEVDRLNALKSSASSLYFWRATRWYPDGRKANLDATELEFPHFDGPIK